MYHEDWLRLSIKMSEMLKAHGLCKMVDLHIPGTMLGMGFSFGPSKRRDCPTRCVMRMAQSEMVGVWILPPILQVKVRQKAEFCSPQVGFRRS